MDLGLNGVNVDDLVVGIRPADLARLCPCKTRISSAAIPQSDQGNLGKQDRDTHKSTAIMILRSTFWFPSSLEEAMVACSRSLGLPRMIESSEHSAGQVEMEEMHPDTVKGGV